MFQHIDADTFLIKIYICVLHYGHIRFVGCYAGCVVFQAFSKFGVFFSFSKNVNTDVLVFVFVSCVVSKFENVTGVHQEYTGCSFRPILCLQCYSFINSCHRRTIPDNILIKLFFKI